MSASRTHACFESHTPLVNGCVNDVLFNAGSNVRQTLSQFVNISKLCLVDALLHCSPHFVIHRVKIWTVQWPLFRWNKVRRVSRRKSSIVSRARCAGALSCWNTNSFPDICLMTGNNFCRRMSAARRGNKHHLFSPPALQKTTLCSRVLKLRRTPWRSHWTSDVYTRDVPMHARVRDVDVLNTCCTFICIDLWTSR